MHAYHAQPPIRRSLPGTVPVNFYLLYLVKCSLREAPKFSQHHVYGIGSKHFYVLRTNQISLDQSKLTRVKAQTMSGINGNNQASVTNTSPTSFQLPVEVEKEIQNIKNNICSNEGAQTNRTGDAAAAASSGSASIEAPGPYDCICARGKMAMNHSGNRYFRSMVKRCSAAYEQCNSSLTKRSLLVSAIVNAIRAKGNGFIKQQTQYGDAGRSYWCEVSDHVAREKVGQLLRETLNKKYKSSHTAKKQRMRRVSNQVNESLASLFGSNPIIQATIDKLTQDAAKLSMKPICARNDTTATIAATNSASTHHDRRSLTHHISSQSFSSSASSVQQRDELLKQLFDDANIKMLREMKRDRSLLQRFLQATTTKTSTSTMERSSNLTRKSARRTGSPPIDESTKTSTSSSSIISDDDDDDESSDKKRNNTNQTKGNIKKRRKSSLSFNSSLY